MNFKRFLYIKWTQLLFKTLKKPNQNFPEFYIISAGRSGSTLLRKLLMQGGEVHIPPESNNWIPEIMVLCTKYHFKSWEYKVHQCLNYITEDPAHQYWELDTKELKNNILQLPKQDQNAQGMIHHIYDCHRKKHNVNTSIVGDKTPHLSLQVSWLKILNPQAKFIHIVRDPRAVVNSRMKVFDEKIEEATHRWNMTIDEIRKHFSKKNKNFIEVKYEELINQPAETLKQLCQFLEIRYSSEMLSHQNLHLGDDVMEHHQATHQPLNKKSVHKWKDELSEEQITFIESNTKIRQNLGY